jgi:hypothetical protein
MRNSVYFSAKAGGIFVAIVSNKVNTVLVYPKITGNRII